MNFSLSSSDSSLRHVYLPHVDGAYGDDIVLLNADLDLSSNLPPCGYTVTNFLPAERLSALIAATEKEVKRHVQAVCSGNNDMENFSISRYHEYVVDHETHEAVYRRLRNGFQLDRNPSPLAISAAEVSERVSEVIGHKVELWLGVCNLRLCRPNKPDNNPLHRDVYLPRLRDMINIYVPIAGSNAASSLGIVPGSHKWPESDIMRTADSAMLGGRKFSVPAVVEVRRSSAEAKVQRPNPGSDECLVFSPYLIHGGGSNDGGSETRCSLEMRFCIRRLELPAQLPPLLTLGMGTIWFGLPWPPGSNDWTPPGQEEVAHHLGLFIDTAANMDRGLIIDTAAAYRGSEARLGEALSSLPHETRKRIIIATKFGEYYEESIRSNKTDFSKAKMVDSLQQSSRLLGQLDIVYMHITSKLTEDEAVRTLQNSELVTELLHMRFFGTFGIRKLGITISNASVLHEVIAQELVAEFDVLQVPVWLAREQSALVEQWKRRRLGNLVVLNSPVRYKQADITISKAYKTAAAPSFVDVVLTGTRRHLPDTITTYYGEKPEDAL